MRDDVREPEVLVVGGGPAGSTTARLLAAQGRRVLLLERRRFPRAKACGECLNPGAVAALARLGLLDRVLAAGPARIRGWDLHTGEGAVATGRFGPDVGAGLALPREVLDQVLLDAAREAGVSVLEEVRVTAVRPAGTDTGPSVRAEGSEGPLLFRPRLVVGADGLRSTVARAVDAVKRLPRLRKASMTFHLRGEGPPPDRGRLHVSERGTVGLAPLESDPPPRAHEPGRLWNLTVVVPARAAPRTLQAPRQRIVEEALARAVPDWRTRLSHIGEGLASGPFDWPCRPVPRAGVVLVGDAAGYFDPLTGQGIYRALRSAELAAEAIEQALRGRVPSDRSALATYARRLARETAPSRRVQRVIEAVLTRRRLRGLALDRLSATPELLDALVRVTGDARPVRSLASPGLFGRLAATGGS